MKTLLFVVLIALTLVSLAACGSEKEKEAAATDFQTPNSSASQNQTTEKDSESAPAALKPAQSADGIDVDLTKLSSTMVYSEVYNMMYSPDDYIGKTVKMKGQFDVYQAVDENGAFLPGQIYFACVIADATACCAQGLEFVLTGDYTYPDDYPELGTEITVVGTFQTYEENGYLYCQLVDAKLWLPQ